MTRKDQTKAEHAQNKDQRDTFGHKMTETAVIIEVPEKSSSQADSEVNMKMVQKEQDKEQKEQQAMQVDLIR